MSEFKLPPPRRLLRCEILHHDDALIGRDMREFDEIALFEPTPVDGPDLLLVIDELVDELVDELSISLTLLDSIDQVDERVAEVA